MKPITTDRLLLEPLVAAHAEAMFLWLADPEVHRFQDHAPPASTAHLRVRYGKLETRRSPDGSEHWLNWVLRPGGRSPIGYVQATILPGGAAYVAYVLARNCWGRGYALEAARAMLDHLAAEYGVVEYMATVEVENVKSIALLQRLLFRLATAPEVQGRALSPTERLYLRGAAPA
jgi:RimJ/RimL family protein N-acetyltransferase